jgi:hypothetical protein
MRSLLCFLLISGAPMAAAQERPTPEPLPIQDNSFLIEEAYNQERGVVQHINTFLRARGGAWGYTFTQEWPVVSQRHQLSYTIPVARPFPGADAGIGDIALNYRFQAVAAGNGSNTAFAPRLTVLLPTGSSRRALGNGSTGAQFNLPLSVQPSRLLVLHSNVGGTYIPSARDTEGVVGAIRSYTLGQSAIWLTTQAFNVMLEASWTRFRAEQRVGKALEEDELLLSPGFRAAINMPSGLQIVPGLSFPFGVGPSRGERSVFFYLSFEHAFAKTDP